MEVLIIDVVEVGIEAVVAKEVLAVQLVRTARARKGLIRIIDFVIKCELRDKQNGGLLRCT